MIARNRQTNTRSRELFEAEFLERVCFERRKNDRKLQATLAHARDVLLDRPIVQLRPHIGHRLLKGTKELGHHARCRKRAIANVQLALALPGDRACFPTASSVCFRIARASSRKTSGCLPGMLKQET